MFDDDYHKTVVLNLCAAVHRSPAIFCQVYHEGLIRIWHVNFENGSA